MDGNNYDLYKNKNVEWMSGTGTKACYLLFLFLVFGFFHVIMAETQKNKGDVWLVTNVIHGVSTFTFFHWIKGCPDDSTQGEYNALTLYEQIDAGVPWTNTKKAQRYSGFSCCRPQPAKRLHAYLPLS